MIEGQFADADELKAFDRGGRGLTRRCAYEPAVLIGVDQVGLRGDGPDAVGARAIGEQLRELRLRVVPKDQ